jgi:hypothetical protein
MPQTGRQFRQWLEHKAPLRHSRVRNLQLVRSDLEPAIEEDVDVDGPRTLIHQALPAQRPLDLLNTAQKLEREKGCLNSHHHIQKPRLIQAILRICFINGRQPGYPDSFRRQTIQGCVQMGLAVSDVRS